MLIVKECQMGGGGKSPLKTCFLVGVILFLILFNTAAYANNLALTSPSLINKNTTNHTWDISFSVSWGNSWCDSLAACNGDPQSATSNWDAAWIFAKFAKWNSGTSTWGNWTHCTLAKDNGALAAPTGAKVTVGCNRPGTPSVDCSQSDAVGKGAFIYRNAAGTGSNAFSGAALRWLYGTDGVGDTDTVKVNIFGIEMVYIPSGTFYVGDVDAVSDGGDYNSFYAYGCTSPNCSYQISSESAITVGTSAGNFYYRTDNAYAGDLAGPIPAAFPKGYNAFYIMKYDVSQGEWCDFLNMLTRTQQNTRTATQSVSTYAMSGAASGADVTTCVTPNWYCRNAIRLPPAVPAGAITFGCDLNMNATFNESSDGEGISANWVSWMDQAAFAAWAGLRPFTELEFEKAARGPQMAVDNEYAWGDATVDAATTSLNNSGANNEAPNQGNLNYASSVPRGPYRVGSFAGAATTRHTSGASYFGVMDLSGNLWKRPVSVGGSTGRSFDGMHGDGSLSVNGNATVSTWPGYSGSEVTGATAGSGFRGGAWNSGATYARVSDRYYASNDNTSRSRDYGARAARTSP